MGDDAWDDGSYSFEDTAGFEGFDGPRDLSEGRPTAVRTSPPATRTATSFTAKIDAAEVGMRRAVIAALERSGVAHTVSRTSTGAYRIVAPDMTREQTTAMRRFHDEEPVPATFTAGALLRAELRRYFDRLGVPFEERKGLFESDFAVRIPMRDCKPIREWAERLAAEDAERDRETARRERETADRLAARRRNRWWKRAARRVARPRTSARR